MLIEFHLLQNHAPSNLNRDDSGSPKDCIFGGIRRSRISSQCLKHAIRKSTLFTTALNGYLGSRTRIMPGLIMEELNKNPGEFSEELIKQIGRAMTNIAKKSTDRENEEDGNDQEADIVHEDQNEDLLLTPQGIFLTVHEIRSMADILREYFATNSESFKLIIGYLDPETKLSKADTKQGRKKSKDLLQKLAKAINWKTVDVALFGRMITSPAFVNVSASLQVAHAISTHKMEHEFDYFATVDDILEAKNIPGASMIGDVEFNSACYYKYLSLDYDSFIENLAGPEPDEETKHEAKRIGEIAIQALLRATVFTTPSGKQNSFAAHQLPDAILIEVRPKQTPISYANAFIKPSQAHGQTDLVEDSLQKLKGHVELLTRKFSLEADPRLWFCTREVAIEGTTTCETLDDLMAALAQVVAR